MSAIPSGSRDVYANLLRDTRGMRREQANARDSWYAGLRVDRKEAVLFELEMLLKGFACFNNPRNQPGAAHRAPAAARDFREELRIVRDALSQSIAQIRLLLGPTDRAYVFSRYLESVLPEDAERSRLLKEQLSQDTPHEALFVLRNTFGSFLEIADGMMRLGRIPHRLFSSLVSTITREIGRNAYFNPLTTLEFRSEFDRIRDARVLDALHGVEEESAHRVAALGFLTFFRALRYLDLLEAYTRHPTTTRRAYVILAVLRSDVRALCGFLERKSGDVLAGALEREILTVPAVEIAERYDELRSRAETLEVLRAMLEGISQGLRVDVRDVFERVLPEVDAPLSDEALGQRLREGTTRLRSSLEHAIRSLAAAARPGAPVPEIGDPLVSRALASDRLRRDIWMFLQVLRAFLAKGNAARGDENLWSAHASFGFVHQFLGHFRAIGYQLVRQSDYERLDAFIEVLDSLGAADLLSPERLEDALTECAAVYRYLEGLFERVCMREELVGHPFDKPAAANLLRAYLGVV